MLVPYSLAVQWKVGRGCCFTLNFFSPPHGRFEFSLPAPGFQSFISFVPLVPLPCPSRTVGAGHPRDHGNALCSSTPYRLPENFSERGCAKLMLWHCDPSSLPQSIRLSIPLCQETSILVWWPLDCFLSLVDRSVFRVPPEEPDVVLFMITRLIEPSLRNWMTKI